MNKVQQSGGWLKAVRKCLFLLATPWLMIGASALSAQPVANCGLTAVTETTELIYPPIAKAADVSGSVIFIASFAPDGTVSDLKVLSGAPMLAGNATKYVRGWKANAATGVRNCPVVITFRAVGQEHECAANAEPTKPALKAVSRQDLQHVTITQDRSQSCYTVCY